MSEALVYNDARGESQPAAEENGLSPAQLVRSLRRHWLLIALCGVLFAAAGYAYTVTSVPKKFTTSATISVAQPQVNIPVLQGALTGDSMPDPMPVVRSEVQVLTSRALIQKVADALNLEASPEFNATLRPLTWSEELKRRISAGLPALISTPLISVGLLPDTTETPAPPPESAIRESVVGAILQDLSIINDGRSLIVVVQCVALEPDVAADIVNTLIRLYVQDRAQGRTAANVDANSELTQRVKDARAEIDALEAKIGAVRVKYNLVQTRAGSVGQQQLEDLGAALTRASSDRAQAVANYQRAATLARTGVVSSDNASVLGSGSIGTLRDREATAGRLVAQLSTTLGPANPQLKAAQAELASARAALSAEAQRVVGSLGAQADAATAREAEIKRQLGEAQTSAGNLTSVQSELAQLEKDADSRRAIYQTLLQGEAQTASKKVGSEDTGVRVVSTAVPPAYPSSPKPKVAAVMGLLSGFAFGGLIALARGRRDRGFIEPGEVAQALGIAPLAVLPRAGRRPTLFERVGTDAAGPDAEALRSLRTRLRFHGRNSAPRSVLFVSAGDEDGAAEVAAAFARVAAADGLRVLLLECNLARPSLAGLLKVTAGNGLVEALEGRQAWQDHVVVERQTGLAMLLAPDAPGSAARLLGSMQLQNIVAEARDDYNLVVMTGQPVGDGSQAMVVATIVESVILLLGRKQASREDARTAVRTLTTATKRQPVVAFS